MLHTESLCKTNYIYTEGRAREKREQEQTIQKNLHNLFQALKAQG